MNLYLNFFIYILVCIGSQCILTCLLAPERNSIPTIKEDAPSMASLWMWNDDKQTAQLILIFSRLILNIQKGRLRGLAVECWTTYHYHPCSNPGTGISEGCFIFDFASLPVHKSGRKTSIIIIISILTSRKRRIMYVTSPKTYVKDGNRLFVYLQRTPDKVYSISPSDIIRILVIVLFQPIKYVLFQNGAAHFKAYVDEHLHRRQGK